MPRQDYFVSVVAPLYNDADIVEEYVEDVMGLLAAEYENYELVLVDDGSDDDTVERVSQALARHQCMRLIVLSRRFGRETAISAGLDSVIGDFVVVMLPDRDPVSLIPQIVEECRTGAGVVSGVLQDRRDDPLYYRIGSRMFYWYLNDVLKIGVPRNSTDFRVFSRQALNAMVRIRDQSRYLRTFGAYVGYGAKTFTYAFEHRRQPPRRKSAGYALRTAVGMVVANTTHPLRFVSLLALVLSVLSMAYAGYVLLVRLLARNVVPGWATQSLQISVMFFFVFLILSMLCAYVGRLLAEVRDRPLYYVMEERNSSVMVADEERKNVVTDSQEDTRRS